MRARYQTKRPFLTTYSGHLLLGAGIGIGIAICIPLSMELRLRWTLAVVGGLLIPAVAVLSGDVKRLLTGLLIFCIPLVMAQKMLIMPYEGFHIANGIGYGIFDVPLTILIGWWALGLLTSKEQRARLHLSSGLNRVVLVYMGVAFLSLTWAHDRMLGVFDATKIVKAWLIFLWVSHNIRSDREHRYFAFFILFVATVQSVIVMLQYLQLFPLNLYGLTGEDTWSEAYFHGQFYLRPPGTLQHANILGHYVSMSIPLASSLLMQPRLGRWFRLFCWFAFLTGFLAVILCFSRAAWLNLAVSTTAVLMLHYRNLESRRRVINTMVVLSVCLIAIILYHWTAIMDRLFYSPPEMIEQRWEMIRDGLRMWSDYPLFGVGVNNYSLAHPDYRVEGIAMVVHNIYVLHLAEMGVIGLGAFLLVMVFSLREAFRLTKVEDAFRSSMAIGMVGIVLGALAAGVFCFGWRLYFVFYLFWAEMGWLVALDRCREEEVHKAGQEG